MPGRPTRPWLKVAPRVPVYANRCNSTGFASTAFDLRCMADIVVQHNLVLIEDPGYERLTHTVPRLTGAATLPGLHKNFSGHFWSAGFLGGPPALVQRLLSADVWTNRRGHASRCDRRNGSSPGLARRGRPALPRWAAGRGEAVRRRRSRPPQPAGECWDDGVPGRNRAWTPVRGDIEAPCDRVRHSSGPGKCFGAAVEDATYVRLPFTLARESSATYGDVAEALFQASTELQESGGTSTTRFTPAARNERTRQGMNPNRGRHRLGFLRPRGENVASYRRMDLRLGPGPSAALPNGQGLGGKRAWPTRLRPTYARRAR